MLTIILKTLFFLLFSQLETAAGRTTSLTNTSPTAGAVASTETVEYKNKNSSSVPSSVSTSNNNNVQEWLNEYISLPAGYRTTRRDALKFISLGGALGSGYVALSRAKVGFNKYIFLSLYIQVFDEYPPFCPFFPEIIIFC